MEVVGERLPQEDEHQESRSGKWDVCGRDVPRSEIVFFSKVIIIYVVVSLLIQLNDKSR